MWHFTLSSNPAILVNNLVLYFTEKNRSHRMADSSFSPHTNTTNICAYLVSLLVSLRKIEIIKALDTVKGRAPLLSKGTFPQLFFSPNQIFALISHYKVTKTSSFSFSSHPESSTSKSNSKSFQVVYLLPFLGFSTHSKYSCASNSSCQVTNDFHGTLWILFLFDLFYSTLQTYSLFEILFFFPSVTILFSSISLFSVFMWPLNLGVP